MVRNYLYAVLCFIVIMFTFGFVVPFLVSAKSTELVLAGISLVIVSPLVFYYIVKKWCRQNKEEAK